MALARESSIYTRVYDLASYIFEVTRKFSNVHKATIARRIEDKVLDMSDTIVRANSDKAHRVERLNDLLVDYEQLQFLINLAVQCREISFKQQAHIVELMSTVGKQAQGWKKASMNTNNDKNL